MKFLHSRLRFILFLTPMVLGAIFLGSISAKPRSPNVLFIAVDDLNNWALGKREGVETPNIDRLGERGVRFTNAHCAAPACNPSRVSVLTGIHPATSGVYYNWQDWRTCENLKEKVTLPGHFRNHGYVTLGGGKIYHAASLSEKGHQGLLDPEPWDDFFPSKERQLPIEVTPPTIPTNGNKDFYRGFFDWAALDIEDNEMGDGKVVSWAEKQLSETHEKPLFLAVGIYRPHIPWYTPRSYFDRYPIESVELPEVKDGDLDDVPEAGKAMARRDWQAWIAGQEKWKGAVQGYLASVSFADAMVGRLLDALDNGPMAENTIVVLWSDHGYHLGHKEHWEKFALWEQTTQVPLVISAPGMPRGQTCHRPVSLLDVYPTLADLSGTTQPEHLQGQSLVPFLKNAEAASGRMIVTTQGKENHAVTSEHWRYIRYADGSVELYDHRSDPNEFTNLATQADYRSVIEAHAAFLPENNAELNPDESTREKKKGSKK